MRPALNLVASVMLALTSALALGSSEGFRVNPSVLSPSLVWGVIAPKVTPAQWFAASPDVHFESIGLSLRRPYVRGKIPVVLIHGLGATPGRGPG